MDPKQFPSQAISPTVEVMPTRGRYRALQSLDDVKRHMARAVRKLETGGMDPDQGRAVVYALKSLAALMQEMDTERRLAEMEEELCRLKAMRAMPARQPEPVR